MEALVTELPGRASVSSWPIERLSVGTNALGGGGNFGRSNASICVADHAYVCPSFRIWAAACWRTSSLCAASASSSLADLDPTAAASGSLRAARAASRFA